MSTNATKTKIIKYCNGDVYEGEIDADEKPHGEGKYIHCFKPDHNQQSSYTGQWKNGKRHGKGIYLYTNGDVYDGLWKNNERHGPDGQYTYRNPKAKIFKGHWVEDKKCGYGVMLFTNGDKYKGMWQDNKREDDRATYTWADGSKHVGKYKEYNPLWE